MGKLTQGKVDFPEEIYFFTWSIKAFTMGN